MPSLILYAFILSIMCLPSSLFVCFLIKEEIEDRKTKKQKLEQQIMELEKEITELKQLEYKQQSYERQKVRLKIQGGKKCREGYRRRY